MASDNYSIRTATRQEIDLAVEWAAMEGWNPGLHDAACYHTADPGGFLVGVLDGEPIATISAVRYGETFGFMGFYIVKPEHRNKGYGLRIWNAAIERLAGRSIGLDGVVEQQDNYRKSGFTLAYRNIRHEGRGGGASPEKAAIVDLGTMPFRTVSDYERPFFPEPRDVFLHAWINQPDSAVLGVMEDGRLAGYGAIRNCRSGYKIGPLHADRPDLAEALFRALAARAGESDPVFLDTPEANPMALDLAQKHGMQVVFETARMYKGDAPTLPLDRIFGVCSFEVG